MFYGQSKLKGRILQGLGMWFEDEGCRICYELLDRNWGEEVRLCC